MEVKVTHTEYDAIIDDIVAVSPDDYYKYVFCHPLDFYRNRVDMIGAKGFDRVLDVGHGFGQWTIALNEKNNNVVGIDRNEPRFQISQILKSHYNQVDLDLRLLDVANLCQEFQKNSFDMVWSWCTLQFMDRSTAMTAFNNMLKIDGNLFLGGVNTSMKWLHKYFLGIRRGIRNRSYYKTCYKGFRGQFSENGANAVNFRSAAKIAKIYGFEVLNIAYDGEIHPEGVSPLYFEETPLKIFQNIELQLIKVRDLSD